jgi:hypothetical protein
LFFFNDMISADLLAASFFRFRSPNDAVGGLANGMIGRPVAIDSCRQRYQTFFSVVDKIS